jgi:lysophospholipase L1-like esterase
MELKLSLIAGVRAHPWLALLPCALIVAALVRGGVASPPAAARANKPAAGSGHRASSPGGITRPAAPGRRVSRGVSDGSWVASWAASAQAPTTTMPLSMHGFHESTLREIVFSSAAGTMVRVRLTNEFGTAPLFVARASVALAGPSASLVPGTAHRLLFAGETSVTIPAGGDALSDPVPLNVPALSRLAISIYVPGPTGPATFHAESHDVNYLAPGSHVLDENIGPFGQELGSWFFIDAVDTYGPPRYLGALVALGDSITAGVGSTADADANWPDDLARRLDAGAGDTLSVVDAGIGGNRILNASECCGDSAIDRFGIDVLSETGVRDVILLEGVNDLGFSQKHTAVSLPHTSVTATQMIAGDERIIAMAHAAGLRIFGATILPFQGARYWTPAAEIKREAVNRWILTSGAFDGVLDFSAVMADPANPLRLNPAYDSGDHLHPNDTGYQAMANAIPLSMLLGP